MSETDSEVTCATHGKRRAAFVCQHLFSGSDRGFHWGIDPEDPDGRCPDAWCDQCEKLLQEAGEWTDSAAAAADIKVVCEACYEKLRERNWGSDRGALKKLVKQAVPLLRKKQDQLGKQFDVWSYDRWDWDQDTGQLVFSHGGQPKVIADIVFVGSISTRTDTWLWSWANTSHLEPVKAKMREVRSYGEEHHLLPLACAHWDATQEDGWEMTAIAAHLLGAAGAYRTPSETGFTYMVMTSVKWAQ